MKEFMWRSEWNKMCPTGVYNLTENELKLFQEAKGFGTTSFGEISMYSHTKSIYVKVNTRNTWTKCQDYAYLYSDSTADKYRKEISQSIKKINEKYTYYLELKKNEQEIEYYKDKIVEDIPYNDYEDIKKLIAECK